MQKSIQVSAGEGETRRLQQQGKIDELKRENMKTAAALAEKDTKIAGAGGRTPERASSKQRS